MVVSGRKESDVKRSVELLGAYSEKENVAGWACEITDPEQVANLWEKAAAWAGGVDVWVNNAGRSHVQANFWELPTETLSNVIRTNLDGLMYGSAVALRGMIRQGRGELYNMEGLGSNGMKVAGLSVYGTSKSAVRYFTEALAKEAAGTPVLIGALSPGMVLTDLLTNQKERSAEEWERTKRVYNILANHEETVTPWLVEKMLGNRKNSAALRYLTPIRMAGQLFAFLFLKRNLFDKKEINA